MDLKHFHQIGYIKKSFGYKGEMIFVFNIKKIDVLDKINWFFFDRDGEHVPFYVEIFTIRDDKSAIVKIEDINNADQAKKFTGCGIYLPFDEIKDQLIMKQDLTQLIGFKVVDSNKGEIGILEEILSLIEQDILKVKSGEKEILIPAVDEFIIDIDLKNKVVTVLTPNGLLDL